MFLIFVLLDQVKKSMISINSNKALKLVLTDFEIFLVLNNKV
jgi:hypothetical protein